MIWFDDNVRKLTDEQKQEMKRFHDSFTDGGVYLNPNKEERTILQASYLRGTFGNVRAFAEKGPVVSYIAGDAVHECTFGDWLKWAADATVAVEKKRKKDNLDRMAECKAKAYAEGAQKTKPFEKRKTEKGDNVWKSPKRSTK